MINPPSLQRSFTLIWSGDPALVLPADPAERENVLRVARETGEWKALLGGEPSRVVCRQIGGACFRWLISDVRRKKLSELEFASLAVRLSVERIENWNGYELELGRLEGYPIASTKLIDDLDSVDKDIVNELGAILIERADGPSPKS